MPNTYFQGPPERTVSGGATTQKVPADGSYTYTDSAGNAVLGVTGAGALKIGGTTVSSTAAELNLVDDLPATFTFSPAQGAANVCEVTITAKDAAGVAMTRAILCLIYLSDASTGVGITATSASGAVTAKASSGVDFGAITAKKVLVGQTKTDGTFILSITDTSKTGFYVCAVPLRGGVPSVSSQLVSGNYG